ncbi:MAG: cache domain-containing protein, partial [Candidatus Margulisbacteria bacterium]|nr:cache domain-containing protein [Candidatus Margulisiibacteriota bacterium]
MKQLSLKKSLGLSFLAVILVLGLSIYLLGINIVQKYIIDTAQKQVKNDLTAAQKVFDSKIEEIQKALSLAALNGNLSRVKDEFDLDYIYSASVKNLADSKSEIVKAALYGKKSSGARIISNEELRKMGQTYLAKASIDIIPTPKAIPTDLKRIEKAMAIECAVPVFDETGNVSKVVYGGLIINREFSLVDKIRNMVFENSFYESKPMGTVTVFLDDVRIATNVFNNKRERAVGTRVSQQVYEKVVKEGALWIARAFVVDSWYLTSYKPIYDLNNKIIGILYVGILEKPFLVMQRNILLVFLIIILLGIVLATIVAYLLASWIAKPIFKVIKGTVDLAHGNLSHSISEKTTIKDLNQLAEAFNNMAIKIQEQTNSLKDSNKKLSALNKNYLDLIGFVSHELKGILSSAVMNTYSLKDGYLGEVNEVQKKALNSISRNLDYLSATVKNFLDLSRIEKGELNVNLKDTLLKENIIDTATEAYEKQVQKKQMQLDIQVPEHLVVKVDPDLILIVINNLLSNAIKYGTEQGKIEISANKTGHKLIINVFNEGEPIKAEEENKLFKKFSRVSTALNQH